MILHDDEIKKNPKNSDVSSRHGCPLAYITAPSTRVQRPATLLSLCATLTTLINNNIIALD